MPIHIGEVVTDVQMVSPESGGAGGAAQEIWQQLAQQRMLQERLLDDAFRTSAQGNED